jgi:hypothetical protein
MSLKKLIPNTLLKRVFATTALIFLLFMATYHEKNDMIASSVMITNTTGNSGGTGVILDSSPTKSTVLTNSHVCGVVEKGGLVSGQAGTFLVTTYKRSQAHDICMITVDGDLGYKTKLASRPPTAYYENATIAGHPSLFPCVKTAGHFSGRKTIEVMVGAKKCTEDDLKDPGKMMLCLLTGGIPEVKRYDSTLVTATIMPGSSGSGVYNSNNELSGLAFAGSGSFGYAFTVPYEYLANFINNEAPTLSEERPSQYVDLFADSTGDSKKNKNSEFMEKARKACSSPDAAKIKNICDLIGRDLIFYK